MNERSPSCHSGMIESRSDSQRLSLVNALLQRGVSLGGETHNRFNGFYARLKTVETVRNASRDPYTPLKQGVNWEESISFYNSRPRRVNP